MTHFGPATESCTYTLLAPTLGILLMNREQGSGWHFVLRVMGYALFLLPILAMAFPGGKQIEWLGVQPLGAVLIGLSIRIRFISGNPPLQQKHFGETNSQICENGSFTPTTFDGFAVPRSSPSSEVALASTFLRLEAMLAKTRTEMIPYSGKGDCNHDENGTR